MNLVRFVYIENYQRELVARSAMAPKALISFSTI